MHFSVNIQGVDNWLVFNGTFSTKNATSCHAKIKSLLKILIWDRKLKYVVYGIG